MLALSVAPAPALAAPDNGNTFTLDLACSDGHAQVAHHDNPDTAPVSITVDDTVWAHLPR